MKKVIIRMGQEVRSRDEVALAMWGRVKSQVFRDKRKTLERKAKHRAVYEW